MMDTSQSLKTTPVQRGRQRWPLEEKRRIVAATLAPGASVAVVARENGVNANQVFAWRRRYQQGRLAGQTSSALLPVRMAPEANLVPDRPVAGEPPPSGLITIETARGKLRVEAGADHELLALILERLLP